MAANTTKTDQQLESEIDRLMARQQEIAAEQERRQQQALKARSEAQDAWRQKLYDQWPALEEQLEDEARDHYLKAQAVVVAGDLIAAWQEWIEYKRTHYTRVQVRVQGLSAAHALGLVPHVASELRADRGDFVTFLTSTEHAAVEAVLDDRVSGLIGTLPD
ncbi:hypothetical protein [Demequina capsici]|uniref:Uncharacterized protein n=1 Tax=Demequina capsici TaxID=3075620 RepID=A0AA96FAB5_9MICO|nr:hypothetical protein [Demequina sp. OYTSA14]WNM25645.1 hypothetical protein RN606_05710 [Demequina sp. OYTSA14]